MNLKRKADQTNVEQAENKQEVDYLGKLLNDGDAVFVSQDELQNGSMLNPVTMTTCNDCFHFVDKVVSECEECGSKNVEVIKEEN